jgi:glycosyltransferase involved in cell wall biosynthesis
MGEFAAERRRAQRECEGGQWFVMDAGARARPVARLLKPMRIAIIGTPWVPVPPPAYGGTEAVLEQLIRGLVDLGVEVAYAGHPDTDLPVTMLPTVDRQDIGDMGQTACELAHVTLAYEAADAWGADLVHDNTLLGPLAGRIGVPRVVTSHGPFDSLTTPVFERIGRECALVAISRSQAASAPSVPVSAVVHHGIDVDEWPFQEAPGDYVLFLGRMHPDKGPHRAIDIAREAEVPLVLAAKMREGPELDFFEREVRPRLHADAHFLGEADATTKRRLLASAKGLLNPISWAEPFGMVMVEALACGTPVVVTPCGAAPEIVQHGRTGFLCPTSGDAVAAVRAIDTLDRAGCRADVATRYPVANMVRGYLDVYRRALSRGPVAVRRHAERHVGPSSLQPVGSPNRSKPPSTLTSTR